MTAKILTEKQNFCIKCGILKKTSSELCKSCCKKGIKRSEESKLKQSTTMIRNGTQKGENNPQYGLTGELNFQYGKQKNERTKEKISSSLKEGYSSGKIKNWAHGLSIKDEKILLKSNKQSVTLKNLYSSKQIIHHNYGKTKETSDSIKRASEKIRISAINRDPEKCHTSKNVGYLYCVQTNKNYYYASLWELQGIEMILTMFNNHEIMKFENQIEHSIRISYFYKNTNCMYRPDILVYHNDGSKELIEIKAKWKLSKDEKTIAKIEEAKNWSIDNNIKFTIWDDDMFTSKLR